MTTPTPTAKAGAVLNDANRPLKERFRALFALRNLAGPEALSEMARAFEDKSALLKHEVAYCMGQMGDEGAVPILTKVLEDKTREAIVRHEAAEALGAIGKESVLPMLKEYAEKDESKEVRDTCVLAIERIEYVKAGNKEDLPKNPYDSVDPAPPLPETDVKKLRDILLDEEKSLFERYRAMFSLRNVGTKEAIDAIGEGFGSKNILFRHEIAYVLGQIQNEQSKDVLFSRLRDAGENDMVRHECAEALGSIATDEINKELEKYLGEKEPAVLRESCVVALDFSEYNQSGDFQYADTLAKS